MIKKTIILYMSSKTNSLQGTFRLFKHEISKFFPFMGGGGGGGNFESLTAWIRIRILKQDSDPQTRLNSEQIRIRVLLCYLRVRGKMTQFFERVKK